VEAELVMESVETVEKAQGRVQMSNIFGETLSVAAVFKAIRDNRICF
jgi:predicted RNA-binding protein